MWEKDKTSDSGSGADTEAEDIHNNGLVATRAKRANAGNLYAALRNNLDDADLQKELLEEEEGDAGEYEASDRDDDDAAMESSSDEEDAGPAKEGEEELEGEKVLKRIERQEARKKRKMKDAGLKLPAWAAKKRVKLAADVKSEDGATKPKKKSERANWLPSASDAPTRQSSRALAMANREIIHAHLQQSFQRSEKQRRVMKDAAHRERTRKRADLTREERLEKAAKIAKETKREFGKWEREEIDRQRIRDELLASKRLRDIDGPFVRYWSGSGIWNGQKFLVTRNLPHKDRDMLNQMKTDAGEDAAKSKDAGKKNDEKLTFVEDVKRVKQETAELSEVPKHDEQEIPIVAKDHSTQEDPSTQNSPSTHDNPSTRVEPLTHQGLSTHDETSTTQAGPSAQDKPSTQHNMLGPAIPVAQKSEPLPDACTLPATDSPDVPSALADQDTSLLAGIYEFAALAPRESVEKSNQPSAVAEVTTSESTPSPRVAQSPSQPLPGAPSVATSITTPAIPYQYLVPTTYTSWPPGPQQQAPTQSLSPPPPAPIIREQAMRVCIMLEQHDELETIRKSKSNSSLEPTQTAKILLPSSHPGSFTTEEAKYLTSKHRKNKNGENIPVAPPKQRCAITSWPAKYRDPKTGLVYFDMQMYKAIQRILAGGSVWSGLLGAWVGPAPGGMSIGRPASGVPEGFSAPSTVSLGGIKGEGDVA